MSSPQPHVIGFRKLSLEKRFLIRAAVACAITVACYQLLVRPERQRLAVAKLSLASQKRELDEMKNLPHVVDDIPAAIVQMTQRRDQLKARLKDSGDASTLYDKIGKLGQRCGVRTDRIDPVRVDAPQVSGHGGKNAGGVPLESYGYQIEVIGSYENIARFVDAINSETGVSYVGTLICEPWAQPGSAPKQVRATIGTMHFKLPAQKEKAAASVASPSGETE